MQLEDPLSFSTLCGVLPEHLTLLSLFVYKPSSSLLRLSGGRVEVIVVHLSPELEVVLT